MYKVMRVISRVKHYALPLFTYYSRTLTMTVTLRNTDFII